MDKPTSNEAVHYYSGQSQPSGALSPRRVVRFWSGVDSSAIAEEAIRRIAKLYGVEK